MYANPTFRRNGGAADTQRYARGLCPVAERLLDEEFLWFYHIAYASTEADMHDIVRAVRKVATQRERLSGVSASELGNLAARGQGRIGTEARQ
jgi:hypothetical protein